MLKLMDLQLQSPMMLILNAINIKFLASKSFLKRCRSDEGFEHSLVDDIEVA